MNRGHKKHNTKLFAAPVGLTGTNAGRFKSPKGETFYSVQNGNWTDLNTWETVSGRAGKLPTNIDDVVIRHEVYNNLLGTGALVCNNLNISGSLVFTTNGVAQPYVYGNLNCIGKLLMNGSGNNINPFGTKNYINPEGFSPGVNGVRYWAMGSCEIQSLPYYNLMVGGTGIKYITSDLFVSGALNLQFDIAGTQLNTPNTSVFDIGNYNLYVGQLTDIYNSCTLRKHGKGSVIFNGQMGNFTQFFSSVDFGEVDVEFRNGIRSNVAYNFGYGSISFTTNNQSINMLQSGLINPFFAPINIDNIELSIIGATATAGISLEKEIAGTGTGKLINRSTVNFVAQAAAEHSTATTDFTSYANTVSFAGNYTATISAALNSFWTLLISGTGTKSLGANTTLTANLNWSTNGTLDTVNKNLFIGGSTSMANYTNLSLLATGNGYITFVGAVHFGYGNFVNWSGNPTVEFKNGYGAYATFTWSNIRYKLSTNNQTITSAVPQTNQAEIVDPIQVTLGGSGIFRITSSLPSVTGATLVNNGTFYLTGNFTEVTAGAFDKDTLVNTMGYEAGTWILPYTTYKNLVITGSGTKTVSGNVTINGNVSVSTGILDFLAYGFNVTGTALTQSGARLVSNSAVDSSVNALQLTYTSYVILSGSNALEIKAGITTTGDGYLTANTVRFTTNNQSLTAASGFLQITGNVLISGAITIGTGNVNLIRLIGNLNGDNVLSTFRNLNASATYPFIYNGSNTPMITGILDTNFAANVFVYGNGNQNIKGGTYRSLTFNGGGVKKLQGNVIKTGTYVLTAPATVDLNGFTLT